MELVVGEGSRKGSQPPRGRFRPRVSKFDHGSNLVHQVFL